MQLRIHCGDVLKVTAKSIDLDLALEAGVEGDYCPECDEHPSSELGRFNVAREAGLERVIGFQKLKTSHLLGANGHLFSRIVDEPLDDVFAIAEVSRLETVACQ